MIGLLIAIFYLAPMPHRMLFAPTLNVPRNVAGTPYGQGQACIIVIGKEVLVDYAVCDITAYGVQGAADGGITVHVYGIVWVRNSYATFVDLSRATGHVHIHIQGEDRP